LFFCWLAQRRTNHRARLLVSHCLSSIAFAPG
jgi:hypothetical protein